MWRSRSSSRPSPTSASWRPPGAAGRRGSRCSTSGERRTHTHTEIARWLREEHGVDGWYSQSITVGYERARGLRAPGEHADGFAITASRTIAVPVERLFAGFDDPSLRERWLPGADLRTRTATAPRSARYDWEDGSTRVIVGFEDLGESKSRVALSHERLPDAETAEEMKSWWRERLTELKAQLERGEV